jgi:hypothetical protein
MPSEELSYSEPHVKSLILLVVIKSEKSNTKHP